MLSVFKGLIQFPELAQFCFSEFQVNFNKESLENTTYMFEYDYESIMHYGQFYFRSDISNFPLFWPVCARTV
jgi:hypothetical protein